MTISSVERFFDEKRLERKVKEMKSNGISDEAIESFLEKYATEHYLKMYKFLENSRN